MKTITILLSGLLFINTANAQNVGIGTTSPNSKAALDISSTTQGLLPPRMDSTQRNAIIAPPAGLTIFNTSTKSLQCYNGTSWYSTIHWIGENYGGGMVFFVYDNGQHGLISATTDQSTGIPWNNGINKFTGTSGNGLCAGIMNTTLIIASQMADNPTGNFAAKVCADYSVTVGGINYGDWYLPSRFELNLLYLQKDLVGGFDNYYWSSSEFDANNAWYQHFINGFQDGNKGNLGNVRAIRAF